MQADKEALVFEPPDAEPLLIILGQYALVAPENELIELKGILIKAIDFHVVQLFRRVQGNAFDFGEFSPRHERIVQRSMSLKPEEAERLSFPGPPEVLRRVINWAAINLEVGDQLSPQMAESTDQPSEVSYTSGELDSSNDDLLDPRAQSLIAAKQKTVEWATQIIFSQM